MELISSAVVETTTTKPFSEVLQSAFSKLDLADIGYAALLFVVCYAGARILRKLFRRALERSTLSKNLQSFSSRCSASCWISSSFSSWQTPSASP